MCKLTTFINRILLDYKISIDLVFLIYSIRLPWGDDIQLILSFLCFWIGDFGSMCRDTIWNIARGTADPGCWVLNSLIAKLATSIKLQIALVLSDGHSDSNIERNIYLGPIDKSYVWQNPIIILKTAKKQISNTWICSHQSIQSATNNNFT